MSETYTGTTNVEDIDSDGEASYAALDRRADEILSEAEGMTSGAPPLRQAVGDDVAGVRDWGRTRVARVRGVVEAEPVKATLWALGIGVLIGLLAAR